MWSLLTSPLPRRHFYQEIMCMFSHLVVFQHVHRPLTVTAACPAISKSSRTRCCTFSTFTPRRWRSWSSTHRRATRCRRARSCRKKRNRKRNCTRHSFNLSPPFCLCHLCMSLRFCIIIILLLQRVCTQHACESGKYYAGQSYTFVPTHKHNLVLYFKQIQKNNLVKNAITTRRNRRRDARWRRRDA